MSTSDQQPRKRASELYDGKVIHLFEEINEYIDKRHNLGPAGEKATQAKFAVEKDKNYPFMKDVEYLDYLQYFGTKAADYWEDRKNSIKTYDEDEMFHKLQTDALDTRSDVNNFSWFINQSYFPRIIELGKLNGITPLRFAPHLEFLETQDPPGDDLAYACPPAKAVNYGEGNPSEVEELCLVNPKQDETLRRFQEVGYILMQSRDGSWAMTGHVMVLDLDRDRHPWLILARSWWDNDDEDDDFEKEPFVADDYVEKNKRDVHGIFPGDDNRTTIARFIPYGDNTKDSEKPFLERFCEYFEFSLRRFGQDQLETDRGTSLAKIMNWFERPDGQEVCFDKNRVEFMTRNPKTGEYVKGGMR